MLFKRNKSKNTVDPVSYAKSDLVCLYYSRSIRQIFERIDQDPVYALAAATDEKISAERNKNGDTVALHIAQLAAEAPNKDEYVKAAVELSRHFDSLRLSDGKVQDVLSKVPEAAAKLKAIQELDQIPAPVKLKNDFLAELKDPKKTDKHVWDVVNSNPDLLSIVRKDQEFQNYQALQADKSMSEELKLLPNLIPKGKAMTMYGFIALYKATTKRFIELGKFPTAYWPVTISKLKEDEGLPSNEEIDGIETYAELRRVMSKVNKVIHPNIKESPSDKEEAPKEESDRFAQGLDDESEARYPGQIS